jgi:carbohydrate ABC transporter membrane protein 1, CUT1 family (TC 3.A.1.1.-)
LAEQSADCHAFARSDEHLVGAGGNMLIYLAGLRGIPEEYYEAARIDGAGTWGRFWHITLPLLKPSLLFCLVMSLIGSSQVFGQSYI